jgi:hypothetical protein
MKRTRLLLAVTLLLPITRSHALTPPPQEKQQEKMKTCNAEAATKGLQGADREMFMERCLANALAEPAEAPTTPAPDATPPLPTPPEVPAPPVPTPQTAPPSPDR